MLNELRKCIANGACAYEDVLLDLKLRLSFLYLLQQFISREMDIKINRQHIIQAIKQLSVVERLPKQALEQFCRVFKVSDAGLEFGGIVRAFENKIVDIICQEGQAFQDYLQLPKFRSMGHQLNQKLNNVFRKVWEELPAISKKQQVSLLKKELDELTPHFQTSAQYGSFHLKLLQLYKSSTINPSIYNRQQKKQLKAKQVVNESGFLASNVTLQNSAPQINQQQTTNIFPYFPFPLSAPFPKVQAQEDPTYILDNKQTPQLFQIPRFTMQGSPYQQQLEFFPPIDPSKHIFAPKKQENHKNISQNLFSEDQVPSFIEKFTKYEFIQCVCEGKKQGLEQPKFKCYQCKYSYHFSCLRSSNSNKERNVCPICTLRRDTLYCQVVKQPVKYSWFLQQKHIKDLKVQLNMDQSSQIFQARKKGLQCQLRFLKFDNKKKDMKPSDEYISQGGMLQRASKHSEITLPQLCKDTKDPISFQITLKSDQDKDATNKLFFFGIFLVNLKTTDQIVAQVFQNNKSFPFQYYNQFMDQEGKVTVNLKAEDFGGNLIKYPVRGINCVHAALFDFKSFLQLLVDLKKDKEPELYCPLCNILCPQFVYDSFVYKCIKDFPEYELKHPQAIQICKNGEFAWVSDNFDENGNLQQDIQNMAIQVEQDQDDSDDNDYMEDPPVSNQNEGES